MVYRIYVEKKSGLDNEAKGLLSEAKNLLGIENLEDIRLFNRYDAENITEEMITNELDTAGIPDPDLMIRTSGEQRLSNYLLWQLAYSEFYFTDVLWPDFTKEELAKAIEYYNGRDRRFGGVKEGEN